MTTDRATLYEHEDGRYAAWPGTDSPPWTNGDPAWHRVGPVDVSGLSAAPPVAQEPSQGAGDRQNLLRLALTNIARCPNNGAAATVRAMRQTAVDALHNDDALSTPAALPAQATGEKVKWENPPEVILRAMVRNYGIGHQWDALDAAACTRAADDLEALRNAARQEASKPSWKCADRLNDCREFCGRPQCGTKEASKVEPVAEVRKLDLYDEIECDLHYLFGRASAEGHESGQRLADQVRAKMQRARAASEPSALEIQAVEELAQIGYTVRDGLLYPPKDGLPAPHEPKFTLEEIGQACIWAEINDARFESLAIELQRLGHPTPQALSDAQKRKLVGNYFADDWAVKAALSMLDDYPAILAAAGWSEK